MKTNITLKGLEIGNIKVEDIVFENEFLVKEAWGMKDLVKNATEDILHNMPKYLEQIAIATEKHDELCEKISDKINTRKVKEFIEAINTALSLGEAEDIAIMAYEYLPFKYHNLISRALKEINENKEEEIICLNEVNEMNYKDIVEVLYSITNEKNYKNLEKIEKEIEQYPEQYRNDILSLIESKKKELKILSLYW